MSTRAKLANKVIWTLVFIGALFLAAGLSTLPDHQSLFIVLGVMGVCAALVITLRPWKLLLTMALVTPFQVYLHLGPYPVAIGYMLIGLLAISWSLQPCKLANVARLRS